MEPCIDKTCGSHHPEWPNNCKAGRVEECGFYKPLIAKKDDRPEVLCSVGLDAPPVDIKEKYFELIMAVSIKHPDESRHETALRYIVQAEKGSNEPFSIEKY